MSRDANLPVPREEASYLGPAMAALTQMQRDYVYASLENGGQNSTDAAIRAGVEPGNAAVQAYRWNHNTKVMDAIREEADKRLRSAAVLGASALVEIARDTLHKDRFKAAVQLLDRAGLIVATEHKVTVEHVMTDQEKIAKIVELAKLQGLDPVKLLGQCGVEYVDAEFTPVTPAADDGSAGLEDLLQ